MTRTIIALLSALVLFAGFAAGVEAQTVRIGYLGIAGDIPFYVALEKGYFSEVGIKAQMVPFRSGGDMMAPLGAGQLEAGRGGVNIGLYNAFARGWPVRVAAAAFINLPGHDQDAYVVRADLKEQIKSLSDLKGRKVATNSPTSALVYVLGKSLEKQGVSLKDIELVTIPFPEMGMALANRVIEVAMAADPFPVLIEEKGYGVIWKRSAELIGEPYHQVAVLFFNDDWAGRNRELAKNFMKAYIRAARYYYEAGVRGTNREEMVDVLVKYTALKDRALYKKSPWGFIDPDGRVSEQSLEDQQDWYFRHGYITQKVDISQMVNTAYLKAALAELGSYPRK